MTVRRRKRQRGIEADDSFWIANAHLMAGATKLDLRIHPPPDLCIEVDVSHGSLNRLALYATFGVPEVWRLDGDALRFYHLGANRKYVEANASRSFPFVSPADMMPFIRRAGELADVIAILDEFDAWARERAAKPAAE